MRVIGIETSCDETGIGIYDSEKGLLAHALYSQIAIHAQYGGVVPELASRDHIRKAIPLIKNALETARSGQKDIEGIAYAKGPGLVGALMVGASIAHSLGLSWNVPVIGVHHMEAHLLAVMLEEKKPTYPFLALLVSGGHTLLVHVKALGQYELLGQSLDDATGEAFDKVAKSLGLPYPGGPVLEKVALNGDAKRFTFPRPMAHQASLDFSFSGLKTSVIQTIEKSEHDNQTKSDIAASFQEAVFETLITKTVKAIEATGISQIIVAGGVSANQTFRSRLQQFIGNQKGLSLFLPNLSFCTDNGAMIAYCGCQHLLNGKKDDDRIQVRPRWPLTEV